MKPYNQEIIREVLGRKKRRFSKRTFILIFLFSSLISFSIMIGANTIQFFLTKRVLNQEITARSMDLLSQTESIFNSLHAWIIPLLIQTKSERDIAYLINSDELDLHRLADGIDRLHEVLSTNILIHSIYIYNFQTRQYISTVNGLEDSYCSDIMLPDILSNIQDYGVYRYIPRTMTYKDQRGVFFPDQYDLVSENVFTLVIGNLPRSSNRLSDAIVINIKEEKIREFFLTAPGRRKWLRHQGELLIINDRGVILSHPESLMFGKNYSTVPYIRKILDSDEETGSFTGVVGDQKKLISYVSHTPWKWYFISVSDYDEIFAGLYSIQRTTVLLFFIFTGIAVVLAFFGSKQIYSPIHKLFQYSLGQQMGLAGEPSPDSSKRISEIQYLSDVFHRAVKRANTFDSMINEHQDLFRIEAMKGLLLGTLSPEEDEEEFMDRIKPELKKGPFLLVILMIDSSERLADLMGPEDFSHLYKILRELSSHYLKTHHFFIPMRKDHAALICTLNGVSTGNMEKAVTEITESLGMVQETFKSQLKYTVTIGMSDLFQDYTLFYKWYNKTVTLTQYRFRFGANSLIRWSAVQHDDESVYSFPGNTMEQIIEELKNGKLLNVETLTGELLEEVKNHRFEDFTLMIHLIVYQSNKLIDQFKAKLSSSYHNLKDLMLLFQHAETIPEARNRLSEAYSALYDALHSKQGNKMISLANMIRDNVDENYSDPNLSVDSLAHRFDYSAHYVRLAFKKVHEVSVSEYINEKRIDKCKELLTGSSQAVKKIFKSVGFYNYNYFFTLFKKRTGMTPNEYRMSNKLTMK